VPRITIKDVAQAVGVSIITVSRAVNGHPSVLPEMRALVLSVVERLGYAPDNAAQSLRSRQTRFIGCALPFAAHPVFTAVIVGAEETLRREGYAVVLGNTTDRVTLEADLLSFFHRRKVDGIITTLAREDAPDLAQRLHALDTPIVLLERSLDDTFDSVLTDQATGCHQATSHLLALGHRRIALVTSSRHSWPGRERHRMFLKAYADLGVDAAAAPIRTMASTADFGFQESVDLLSALAPPTAVITGVHELVGLLRAVRAVGMVIPRDLSIIAFGDSDVAELMQPPVSVVRWDAVEVGRKAACLLLERIVGEDIPIRRLLLPVELLDRGSCGPPRSVS
jgi:LacI family transcriptional regulator